jgi:hypothetical protein
MPYGYPLMMMPYPPPQSSSSSDSIRLLEKMMELKSEENKQLMQILLSDRRHPNPQSGYANPQSSQVQPVSSMPMQSLNKKGLINVEEDYQFKKSMAEDLIS